MSCTSPYCDECAAKGHDPVTHEPLLNAVSKPAHYQGKVECIDGIEAAVEGLTGLEGFHVGQVLKYVWRWKRKNGVEDLRKGRWYLDRLIAAVEATK